MDKLPVHLIIGLLKVQLDSHESRLCFASFKAVNDLLDENLVLGNPSVRNESQLSGRDDFIKKRAKFGY